MKKLLCLLLVCLAVQQLHAQTPDPELFRTWYLYGVQQNDLSTEYIVAEIDPPITPIFTITSTLEFNGFGACNTFMGTYTFDGSVFESTDLTRTNDPCATTEHDFFENDYFGTMDYFWYEIDVTGNGLFLRLGNPLQGYALFSEFELSVSENSLNQFKLFPNPVSETLFITSEAIPIENLHVYSVSGELVFSETSATNQIDVSQLNAGLYFAEIYTSEGKIIQKFIKK